MKQVVFNEFNIRMEKSAYLPIATGMLRAYAESQPKIKDAYEFAPFLYHIDSPDNVMRSYKDPDVAAFSVSMWNEQLCLTVAEEVKRRWPKCLIVAGGYSVPHQAQEYMRLHPFIDISVRDEGERAFSRILDRHLESRDFSEIPNLTWKTSDGNIVSNDVKESQPKDMDMYPSPYLEGLFENIMDAHDFEMQATVETTRGCPFPCAFCAWGNDGLSRKYRFHGVERVKKEIEWAADHKVKYLFNADSNFGMHKRDVEITQILVDTKTRTGYPEKFRTCFGKNADERIYDIATRLHSAEMEKGITLALQSNTPEVLKNIRRQNIKMETYQFLQRKFNEVNVPVYSELILGLPGETVESWKVGIENLLKAGLKNQLFIYLCQILPNTEMAKPEYQKEFGIVPHRIELNEIHGALRTKDLTTEYEDIIVTTDAMNLEGWKQMVLFSWLTMVLHSLKVGFFVMLWLSNRHGKSYADFIDHVAKAKTPILAYELSEMNCQILNLLRGHGRGRFVPGYAPIYWDEEEASFLRIVEKRDAFYDEFLGVVEDFLSDTDYDSDELKEVIEYQRLRIPAFGDVQEETASFQYNIPEYFDMILTKQPIDVQERPQYMTVTARYFSDKPTFAKETLMWGRKSGTIMKNIQWVDAT